jgi:hypothetical protein
MPQSPMTPPSAAVFWSKRGVAACAEHAPTATDEWFEESWQQVPEWGRGYGSTTCNVSSATVDRMSIIRQEHHDDKPRRDRTPRLRTL